MAQRHISLSETTFYLAFNDKDTEIPQEGQEEMAEPYIDFYIPIV
jgi:hypothetical protein